MTLKQELKVLYVSTEVAPFAKTGGLADVAGSLPKALTILGNDVRVVMPKYQMISAKDIIVDYPVELNGRKETAVVRKTAIEVIEEQQKQEVPVYLIDNYQFFDRPGIYGYWDEAARFAFFCKAVIKLLPLLGWQPDIIHCNDWQTGPIPMLIKTVHKNDTFYQPVATVYTIHNLFYQGNFPPEIMGLFDLGPEYFTPEQLEFYGEFSYTKAGLAYADVVNTVSNTYAEEIKFTEFGQGFQGLLQHRAKDLFGIVNGIDYELFNPETDQHIYKNYNSSTLANKLENKHQLQRELGLPVQDVPLFGLVHRLVEQKGLDLLVEKLDEFIAHQVQLVFLGTGEPRYEQIFLEAAKRYPDKIFTRIGFDETLAQKIYAASDYFLMPSWFEPCGLGQLISMRYGTIPIVRQVGGLADTVVDYSLQDGNGLVFKEYDSEAFMACLRRAVELFTHNKSRQQDLAKRLLITDYSWRRSAQAYIDLYEQALLRRGSYESYGNI